MTNDDSTGEVSAPALVRYLVDVARKSRTDEAVPVAVRPVIDPLDMTLRDLLSALVERSGGSANDEWINIRAADYPWRRIVASAQKGECEVSRVGRRLMMRREELNLWLSRRRIGPKTKKAEATVEPENDMQRRVRRSLERQGYSR